MSVPAWFPSQILGNRFGTRLPSPHKFATLYVFTQRRKSACSRRTAVKDNKMTVRTNGCTCRATMVAGLLACWLPIPSWGGPGDRLVGPLWPICRPAVRQTAWPAVPPKSPGATVEATGQLVCTLPGRPASQLAGRAVDPEAKPRPKSGRGPNSSKKH